MKKKEKNIKGEADAEESVNSPEVEIMTDEPIKADAEPVVIDYEDKWKRSLAGESWKARF